MMRKFMCVALVSAVLFAGLAGEAEAATTVGEAAGDSSTTCSAGFTFLQDSTGPSSPSYTIPAGGGVLTSWSHVVSAATPNTATMRLVVFQKTGANDYLAVGRSEPRTLASVGLNTFGTTISVQGGELLGLRTGGGLTDCNRDGASGDLANAGSFDPMPGDTFHPNDPGQTLLNIAAGLEPDCDDDGMGDETQDTDTSSCNPVTPPPADTDPPETTITKDPPNKLAKHKAKYGFVSDEAGSSFECKIDKKPFKACSSPKKVKHLDEGKHKFKVRAIDVAGNVDATAAKDKFKVV